jgi:hypothetical protein
MTYSPAERWSAPMAATSSTSSSLGSSTASPGHADAPTASVPSVPYGPTTGPAPSQHRGNGAPPPVNGPIGAARATNRSTRPRGPRRARLQLRHINPWTVLKFSAVLSIALFFVWLIVVGVLFGILDGAGIIGRINDAVTTINGPGSKAPISATIVFGGAAIIGVVNIILFIALSTIGSVVYNLCADLVGGIEITLAER